MEDGRNQSHLASKMSFAQSAADKTSRSRGKKGVEYTRAHMVKIWEDMELAYFRDGLVSLQEIKKQRLSVTDNLNNC